jgi:hypothetical protein
LYRKVQENITQLEDDYKRSADVPPSPPGWVDAVDAVAKIPAKGDPVVFDILEDIHDSLVKAHDKTIDEYRQSRKERHQLLKGMMPMWRRVLEVMEAAKKNVDSLLERVKIIERYMEDYEEILNGTDRAVRSLSESSFKHFFISSLVLTIAVFGALINFYLIALPMSEMVGGNSYIGGFPVYNIAALVIILLEITLGLFLMESLRITRLFPIIHALKDSTRLKMVWFSFIFLFALASVEAGLAYMREMLTQSKLATTAQLLGTPLEMQSEVTWITTAAQMGLGFILPFVLTFVAIPLETFVTSLRSVLGVIAVALIRGVAYVLRLTGNGFYHMGTMVIHAYDVVVFLPLWIEKVVKSYKTGPQGVVSGGRRDKKVGSSDFMKEAS